MYVGAPRFWLEPSLLRLLYVHGVLGLLVAPIVQMVAIAPKLQKLLPGLNAPRKFSGSARRPGSEAHGDSARHRRPCGVRSCQLQLRWQSHRAAGRFLCCRTGHGDGSGRFVRIGQVHTIGLISAFHVPTEGKILVDGVDLSTVRLDSYRTRLGVVLQESFLFDGTIRENVAFSRPNATEEEIMRACRIARVDEFAESFADKYDTIVGERGVKLSGGQRQRISIARAILAEPRILILDEATSSLDSESEQMIQHGLSYLMQGRTTFVIAHRLSTIRRADQILVVEHGEIVERGTHQQLYELQGRYYDLYTKQQGLESNLFLAPGEAMPSPKMATASQTVKSPPIQTPCA